MNIDKIYNKIEVLLNEGTDEEVINGFLPFLSRIDISSQFVETEDGLLTGSILFIQCGDKVLTSDAEKFEWPLQPLPMPEALRGTTN